LLAEAMVTVILAPKWHLSWWEWHVLLTFAFGFVAYSAYVQYRGRAPAPACSTRSASRRPTAASGPSTVPALEELVTTLQERERSGQPRRRHAWRCGWPTGSA
jgi:hypothetical protein